MDNAHCPICNGIGNGIGKKEDIGTRHKTRKAAQCNRDRTWVGRSNKERSTGLPFLFTYYYYSCIAYLQHGMVYLVSGLWSLEFGNLKLDEDKDMDLGLGFLPPLLSDSAGLIASDTLARSQLAHTYLS